MAPPCDRITFKLICLNLLLGSEICILPRVDRGQGDSNKMGAGVGGYSCLDHVDSEADLGGSEHHLDVMVKPEHV